MGKGNGDSATRARTRIAILRAGITILGQNQAASLGEVADAAGVARSTLHRYFPDRADLLAAMRRFADEEIRDATERAQLDQGIALEALVRLCHEYFDQWETLVWSYQDSIGSGGQSDNEDDWSYGEIASVIERGYADGSVDPRVPGDWLQQVLWALIYSGWEFIGQGASKHEALALTLDSLRRLATPGAHVPAIGRS